jgi:uncharacterized membrane protein YeaQ/YmgE (transglycosylase-associated protein family)
VVVVVESIGAVLFGAVVGWITYRTLRRREGGAALSDIATVIGAVGGAAVVALFDQDRLFGFYSIGLAVGFFGYLAVALFVVPVPAAATSTTTPTPTPTTGTTTSTASTPATPAPATTAVRDRAAAVDQWMGD